MFYRPVISPAGYFLFFSRQSGAKVLKCSLCGAIRHINNLWDLK
ncbi:MAG: hypothetical protein E7245_03595 [Enterocloster clostridioformis]|nr:hypothetical protein [Enterocloster clostridioformis]